MQNKVFFLVLTFFTMSASATEFSFKATPTKILTDSGVTEVSFEEKAAIYRYLENENCDQVLAKAISKQKRVTVTVDPQINLILKCN